MKLVPNVRDINDTKQIWLETEMIVGKSSLVVFGFSLQDDNISKSNAQSNKRLI